MESKCRVGRNTEVSEMAYQDDTALRPDAAVFKSPQ